jgi:mannose-6-phosphate isomerase-like protein (cupin superfamily)
MEPNKVNLSQKLASFEETWRPKIVAELNGQYVKLAKFEGEFVWHAHEGEDELFLVLEGELTLRLRDRDVELQAGEMFVVPRGVEHKPTSPGGASVLLFEPRATAHTGQVSSERTVHDPEWI